jgi:hypothetical protein
MRSQPAPELSPDFVEKLEAIGVCLAARASVAGAFQGVLPELFNLPAASVSVLEARIAYAAQLYHHQPMKRPLLNRLFTSDQTDIEQLKRVFGLEYLFLFHRHGFVRQAALEKIRGPIQSPFVLAMIIARMNDWVPQIRQAAVECAQRCFPASSANVLARLARDLFPSMKGWQRWQEEATIVCALVLRDDVRSLLVEQMLESSAASDSRLFPHLLFDAKMDDYLLDLSLNAKTPMIRVTCVRAILKSQVSRQVGWKHGLDHRFGQHRRREIVLEHRPLEVRHNVVELIPRYVKDTAPLVKCLALEAIMAAKATFAFSHDIANQLSEDKSRPVKERAAFILKKIAMGEWPPSTPPTAPNP